MSEIQGIAPPDTSPDKALPLPLPEAPQPPSVPSVKTFRSWLPLYLSKTDTAVWRLSRVLETPSGTDSVLLTICYSALLTSSVLSSISLARLHRTARQIIEKAVALPPDTTVVITTSNSTITPSRLLVLSARLKALSALISDFRIFVRLWGILGIWTWGRSFMQDPPEDMVLRGIEGTQILGGILYQYLENYAYLSEKGVLGWSKAAQKRAWEWSSRFWALHVGLEILKLMREVRKQGLKAEERGVVLDEEKTAWATEWRRNLIVNLAYAPMTIHWSLEQGLMSEFWIGMMGSIVGVTKVRHLWKHTA